MSDFPKDPAYTHYDRFIRSAFVITLIFVVIPIVYELTKHDWTVYDVYYIYYILFIISMILFFLVLCSITGAEIADWINKIDSDTIYITILYISSIVCLLTVYMVIIDYAICSMIPASSTTKSCEYKDLLKFLKDLAELIGSGAIPVLALIVERYENKKFKAGNDQLENNRPELKEFERQKRELENDRSEKREDIVENLCIFVDAIGEDIELENQVIGCLKRLNKPYIPPIGFSDKDINISRVLRVRLNSCGDVFILCGSKSFVFWVKNRLRFYSKYKPSTTRIFVLCANGLKAKFDEYKSSRDIAIIELPNGDIDCKGVISETTK